MRFQFRWQIVSINKGIDNHSTLSHRNSSGVIAECVRYVGEKLSVCHIEFQTKEDLRNHLFQSFNFTDEKLSYRTP